MSYRYDGLYYVTDACTQHGSPLPSDIPVSDAISSADPATIFVLHRSSNESKMSNMNFMRQLGLSYEECMGHNGFSFEMHPIEIRLDADECKQKLAGTPLDNGSKLDAKELFLQQERLKKSHGWQPSGPALGTYSDPSYNFVNDPCKIGTTNVYRVNDREKSIAVFNEALEQANQPPIEPKSKPRDNKLGDLVMAEYKKPSDDLLSIAQASISRIIPAEDRESLDVSKLAVRYAEHWKPDVVRAILLCESHKHTPEDVAVNGPQLRPDLLPDEAGLPRECLYHINNLYYGLNECGTEKLPNNVGTPQFWKLLGCVSDGYDNFIGNGHYKKLLKAGNKSWKSILQLRYEVLKNLRKRGIWLLDASIYGWYKTQQTEYVKSKVSGEATKKQRQRPPVHLKEIAIVYSWELYVKHVVREAASQGHLRCIIPIGKSVGNALSKERLEDVLRVSGVNPGVVEINPPAPNGQVKGGYNRYYHRISATIDGYVDKL